MSGYRNINKKKKLRGILQLLCDISNRQDENKCFSVVKERAA